MSCAVTIRSRPARNIIRADGAAAKATNVPSAATTLRESAAAVVNIASARTTLLIKTRKALVEPAVPVGAGIVLPVFLQVAEAQYGADLLRGQVVYLQNGVAYPVTNAMPQAVLYLLALVMSVGGAGVTRDVLISGLFEDAGYSLLPGRVYLGTDAFPTSGDDDNYHYVPLGHSEGATSFYFQPRERYFR